MSTAGSNPDWLHESSEHDRLMEPGHAAGDFVEAHQWRVTRKAPGLLIVDVHLPDHLKNPQGQLFGGFTPTYVDLISLFTVHAGTEQPPEGESRGWLTTVNMRCDYFEPIVQDRFVIRGEVVNRRGRNRLVATSFYQNDIMAAHAITTIRELDPLPE